MGNIPKPADLLDKELGYSYEEQEFNTTPDADVTNLKPQGQLKEPPETYIRPN